MYLPAGIKRRAIEVAVGGVFLLFSIWLLFSLVRLGFDRQSIMVNGSRIEVTVADSEEERNRGLSGTAQLKDGTGLLFIFPEDGYHGIWMKDMNYPIDIVWLDSDRKVVHLEEFVTPDSYPRTFTPQVPARYVIELPVGSIKSYGLNNGRVVSFNI